MLSIIIFSNNFLKIWKIKKILIYSMFFAISTQLVRDKHLLDKFPYSCYFSNLTKIYLIFLFLEFNSNVKNIEDFDFCKNLSLFIG